MKNIEDFENKIIKATKEGRKRWQNVAELIIEVERNELWRSKKNTPSFTRWIKGLSRENQVSESSLWQAYRAGKKMVEIWNKKNPQNTNSYQEISEGLGDLSASALDALVTIEKLRIDSKYESALESEYLEGWVSVTEVQKVAKELTRAKRENLNPIEVFGRLHRLDFREIIGLEPGPQKILTSIPGYLNVDAIVILADPDEKPIMIGVKTQNFDEDPEPLFDYVIGIIKNSDTSPKSISGILKIDPISGQITESKNIKKTGISDDKKAKLALAILGRLLTTEKARIEV